MDAATKDGQAQTKSLKAKHNWVLPGQEIAGEDEPEAESKASRWWKGAE